MKTIEVKVPALGDYHDVPVIDVLVKPGDAVAAEDGLVTLESDKATMDVPAPAAGTVKDLRVKVGDRVSEGSLVLLLEVGEGRAAPTGSAPSPGAAPSRAATAGAPPRSVAAPPPAAAGQRAPAARPAAAARTVEVQVPDIGNYHDVPVIEVLVKAGEHVKAEDGLVTLESDKATMDVPSPAAGTVKELRVKAGDRVSQGSVVVILEAIEPAPPGAEGGGAPAPAEAASAAPREAAASRESAPGPSQEAAPTERAPASPREELPGTAAEPAGRVHASPSVRKLARELGVELARVTGSGPHGRVLLPDVRAHVKDVMTGAATARGAGTALDLPPWPKVDFGKYGPVEAKPLTRIQRISGPLLARNWVMIPHVTQFDEADITDLEAFRVKLNQEQGPGGVKVTILAFVVKACVAALKRFPVLNSSLEGDHLVLKQYFHVGFAADTPGGLVVPVVKDADRKGLLEIARELGELAARAREAKLQASDMQGGTFSISSLGGIGGTAFTPIINAPEVAVLGVSRTATRPVWDGRAFAPRLLLPLSLSYDHRVVDGALAARFTTFLAGVLADFRRAML